MRRLKAVGATLIAVCALGVLTVTAASANSTVLPEFSTTSSATGTIGKSSVNLEGTTLSCEGGTIALRPTSKKLGLYIILYGGCRAAGESCWSLGQDEGELTIEETGEYHLVSVAPDRTHYLLWFLLAALDNAEALHIECESPVVGLILEWGNWLGLIEEKSGTTYKINIETEGGGKTIKQKITTFGNNSGTEVTAAGRKAKLGTGTERKAGIAVESTLVAMKEGTTILES
jgi:hypothetical protein